MSVLEPILKFQGIMFVCIVLAFAARKVNLIPENTRYVVGDLITNLTMPFLIISSFLMKFDMTLLPNLLWLAGIAIFTQVLSYLFNLFAFRKMEPEQQKVCKYCMYVANSGFLGTPIIGSIYNALGIMYASIANAPLRVTMWSIALAQFSPSRSKSETIKRVLLHPCMIAIYIGLFFLFTRITLPDFLSEGLSLLGDLTTPLSFILVGCLLAEMTDLKAFGDKDILWFSFLRLIVVPGITYLFCLPFNLDKVVLGVSVLFAGMPAGMTSAVLAAKYNSDSQFATRIIVVSTLLSLITLPIWEIILAN